jgi:hypothetical protein
MAISINNRQIIANEFKFIAGKIRSEKELPRKIYYFSGTFGMIQRIFNIDYDINLVLLHTILQDTHRGLNNLLSMIISGNEKVITLPPGLFDSLADVVEELGNTIVNDKDIMPSLEKIAAIGYVTMGNGYYLYQKGILKV